MSTMLTRQPYDEMILRSRCLFHWRADDLSATPITGQAGAFIRDSMATAKDVLGNTYTVPANVPAWDFDTAGVPGLMTGGAQAEGGDDEPEVQQWTILWPPQAMTILLALRQADAALASDAEVLSIGIGDYGDGPGWRVTIQADGDYVVERIDSGSALQTQTHAGVGSAGARRYVLITVAGDGKMSSAVYDGDGDLLNSEGPSAADALPAAFEEGRVQAGDSSVTHRHRIEQVVIASGVRTFDAMMEVL